MLYSTGIYLRSLMIASYISILPWILTLDLSWLAWCFAAFLVNPQHLSYFYLIEPCSEEQLQWGDYSHQWHVVYMNNWKRLWHCSNSNITESLTISQYVIWRNAVLIPWSVHSRCNCGINCWLYPRPYSWSNSRRGFWLRCRFQIIDLKLDCFCSIRWHN